MKDFDKMMEDLQKSLSGLDDKIAKKVNEAFGEMSSAFKKYKNFYDRKTENGDKAENDADGEVIVTHGGDTTVKVKTDKGSFSFKTSDKKRDKFVEMAPYLDEESLHELVVEFVAGNVETEMSEILPYLEEEDISLILNKISETEEGEFKGLRVEDLLPYADEESIDKLFLSKFEKGEIDESLLNYVSDECWHEMVVRYSENENCDVDFDGIYQYLSDEDLNLLFRTYLKRRKNK